MTGFKRIVLIDDNDDDNVYHSIIIKQAGFGGEIVVREDGESGLDFLRRADLQVATLVFLDINMPRMDGFAVAQAALPLLRDAPSVMVLMLTSSASAQDRERALGLEAVAGFHTKPLTVQKVKDLLASSASG